MRFGRRLLEADTLIALVLLVVSLIPALWGYQRIVVEQTRDGVFDQPVKIGSSSYEVLHRGKCIGFVSSNLSEEKGTRALTGNGSLRARVNGELWQPSLKIEANFNILGQMGGGYIEVGMPYGSITLAALDINPVTVILRLAKPGEKLFEHRVVIPGPFELRPVSLSSYRLHYGHLKGGGNFGSLPQAFWNGLALTVIPTEVVDERCKSSDGPAISLDPLRDGLQSLAKRLKFLGPHSPGMEAAP